MKTQTQSIALTHLFVESNTRKTFNETDLKELAQSIKQKGLLQPIGVIKTEKDKYRIIYGERRYRASLINKTKDITCKVYEKLSEHEIKELQIIENLQRQDIHPMDEAEAFKGLIDTKQQNIKDIALQVGKSASFVAQRLKLNDLSDTFKEAFKTNRMTIKTALSVAILSLDSQAVLWEEECESLEDAELIELSERDLKPFLLSLTNAPFNIKDKTLNATMGACTNCPFNSACQKMLFPEEDTTAICTNAVCYTDKSKTAFTLNVQKALEEPGVVLINSSYSSLCSDAKALEEQGHTILTAYDYNDCTEPTAPILAEFEQNLEEGDYDTEEEMNEAYNEAFADYEAEVKQYNRLKDSGKIIKAYAVNGSEKGQFTDIVLIDKSKSGSSTEKTSAKDLQEKLKANTVTVEDFENEKERLQLAEKRKQELDEEKTQPFFYNALKEDILFNTSDANLVKEEKIALIFMMLELGGYYMRKDFNEVDYEFLMTLEMDALDKLNHRITRSMLVHKLSPHNGERPSKSDNAKILIDILNVYNPVAKESIWNAQLVERKKRVEKLNEKFHSLDAKILDTNKVAA